MDVKTIAEASAFETVHACENDVQSTHGAQKEVYRCPRGALYSGSMRFIVLDSTSVVSPFLRGQTGKNSIVLADSGWGGLTPELFCLGGRAWKLACRMRQNHGSIDGRVSSFFRSCALELT